MDLKKENIEPQYTIVELTFKEAREFHWGQKFVILLRENVTSM